MSEIVEQVREGLTEKAKGIETALLYVRDPREIERLQRELAGANAGLSKLNEADTRSPEELEKIAAMIDSSADVETPRESWSDKTPHEKFLYQFGIYVDRLIATSKSVDEQYASLVNVVRHLKKTKGDNAPFMNPVIAQFEGSVAEVSFSGNQISDQLAVKDAAIAIAEDPEFFARLEVLNRFLNNPMNLPHLNEERNAKFKELEASKGVQ